MDQDIRNLGHGVEAVEGNEMEQFLVTGTLFTQAIAKARLCANTSPQRQELHREAKLDADIILPQNSAHHVF
jgi:hypothetical protein